MKKLKTQNTNKGITLIALVITIIVMLILVAVTITMAVNGGLFEYASDAGARTNEAIANEQELANLEANMTVDELINKFTGNSNDGVIPIPEKYTKSFKVGDNITAYLVENEEATGESENTVYDMLLIGTGEMWERDVWFSNVAVEPGNYSEWSVLLENVKISYGVTSICSVAFDSCGNLTSVTIPSSVSSVGDLAFSFCFDLTDIYCGVESQPDGWSEYWLGKSSPTVHWGCSMKLEEITELAKVATVGDLVDYIPGDGVFYWSEHSYSSTNFASAEDGTQNKFEASKYAGSWVVLDIDDEGYVYLISNEGVGDLYLYGGEAYSDFANSTQCILDFICAEYIDSNFAEASYAPTVDSFNEFEGKLTPGFWLRDTFYTGTDLDIEYYKGIEIFEYNGCTRQNLETSLYSSSVGLDYDELGNTLGVRPVVKLKKGVRTSGTNAIGEWNLVKSGT